MEAKLGLALVKIFEFPFIYSYFLPIILGIFLWRKKQLSRPAIYLVVYIMVLFLEDYFHGFFAVLYRNNLWVGRIGLYFETLFVALFFGSSKAEGLTPAEKEEQAKLRKLFIEAFRGNLKATLDNTVIVDKDGNRKVLRKD